MNSLHSGIAGLFIGLSLAITANDPKVTDPTQMHPALMVASQQATNCEGTKIYELAKAAYMAQGAAATDKTYTAALDKALQRCFYNSSDKFMFQDSDPRAREHCFKIASAQAVKRGDVTTNAFLYDYIVAPKISQKKGGPTVSFTLSSPLGALWGAFKYGTIGAVAGGGLGFLYGYSAIYHTIQNTQHDSSNNRTVTTTTTRENNRVNAENSALIGGAAGGILAGWVGMCKRGFKISIDV